MSEKCKTCTIAKDKRYCDLCTANNPYANQPSRGELQQVIASQAAEIKIKTEFIKGLKENNAELAKTIVNLKTEIERLKKLLQKTFETKSIVLPKGHLVREGQWDNVNTLLNLYKEIEQALKGTE
jgi:predicted RNase H-like nuclease (RuvC/YqgF family)